MDSITPLTEKELLETLTETGINPQEFFDEGFNDYEPSNGTQAEAIKKLGAVTRVASGVENDFTRYTVFYFHTHGIHLKLDAWFESYEAINHCQHFGYAVTPKQIVTTEYEKV